MYEDGEQLNIFIAMTAEGKPEGLDGIYAVAGGRMLSVALGILKERAAAEDAVHDSLIKIARFASRYRRDNPWLWVLKIVRNTALDRLKKRRAHPTASADEFYNLTSEDYSPEKRENAILLESAMAKLDEAERKLIYFAYWMDMSVRDIAKETGGSKSSVQRALRKAEEKLKKLLNAGQTEN